MKSTRVLLCVFFAAQLLSGCAWLKRAIEGTETLEGKNVQGMHLACADGSTEICAGAPVQLLVTADIDSQPPMTTWVYDAAGKTNKKGHLDFGDFEFSSSIGKISQPDGMLLVPNTGLELLGRKVSLTVSSKSAPGFEGKLELGVNFKCPVTLNYSGAPGQPGQVGAAGQSGRDGMSESSSGSYARPGGNGENGASGGNGGLGAMGGNGHDLTVDVAKIAGSSGQALILVKITDHSDNNLTRTVLLDPSAGARLTIRADGGPGGAGGSGGFGGRGGMGGTGAPAGSGGDGADGGNGGDGGDGGNGGKVIVRYAANHPELAGLVKVSNRAGAGGAAGAAGGGGSGGGSYSGGRQGRSGRMGNQGRNGRPGASGPQVTPRPVDVSQMFPDAGGLKFI